MHNDDMPQNAKAPATKGDLGAVRADLRGEIKSVRAEFKTELKGTEHRLAKAIVNGHAQYRKDFEKVLSMIAAFRSQMLKFAEGFASRTVKVETEQTFVVYRLDGLEARVKALESRR